MRLKAAMKRFFSDLNRDALKFSALQFTFWLAIAVGNNLTVFMRSIGYSASTVGFINAMASVVGIFAMPFWGMMSDKFNSLKKIIIFLFVAGAATFLLVPVSAGFQIFGIPLLMLLIPCMSFFRYPFFSLSDNWFVQSSNKKGLHFGPIRALGSLSYAAGGILTSILIRYIEIPFAFYISSGLFIFVIWISFHIDDVATEKEKNKKHLTLKELHVGSLFKNYYYMIFLVFAFCLSIMVTCDNSFLAFLLDVTGSKVTDFGIVSGFRSLLEIPLLLLFGKLRKKYPLHKLAIAAGILYSLSAVLTGLFSKDIWSILLFSVFNGMASGGWIACAANYVYMLSSKNLKATAQTILGAASSSAGIVGNLVGGVLIDGVGAKNFYVLIGVFLILATFAYTMLHYLAQKKKIAEFPEAERAAAES